MIKEKPTQETYPEYVGVDTNITDAIEEILARHKYEGSVYVEDLLDIAENCDTAMAPLRKGSIRKTFEDLAKILPDYVLLLEKSFNEHGSETYSEEALPGTPRLLLSNGSKEFPLLQHAAIKNGVADENVQHMYTLLGMIFGSIFHEYATETKH